MSGISVAVLGATGMIGQRFIQMLEDHPWFEIEGLYASERSRGKRLGDVLKVRDHAYLEETLERRIETLDVSKISKSCRIAFSGIPSDLAGPVEAELAQAGVAVFTNAGSHRMDPHVPIVIPEVNPDHLAAAEDQPTYHESGGYIITNANCSSTGIAAPLHAINQAYGLKQVFVSTYQALSGAGYPGVPSLDAVGNVVPFIDHEEEKMETELAKMLGSYSGGEFVPAGFKVMANCARVPVVDGHLESLVLELGAEPSLEELEACLAGFRGVPQELKLPSAPPQPIIVRREDNRPQPAFDALVGTGRSRGMAVTVGRLRRGNGYYKAFAMSHNTLRGGAGGSVLNAELARSRGMLRASQPLFRAIRCEKTDNMTLKFGVPNKGRLNERSVELLAKAGLDLGEDAGRRLFIKSRNQDVEVLFLRAQDIPEFIATGAIDLGVTGQDRVEESGYSLVTKLELGFGQCHMALAVPEGSGVTDASKMASGTRVATSYPNIAGRYFESLGVDAEIIVVSGAAEIMPHLGISDCIVDLVSTGSTLLMNRMVEAGRIMDSQACVFTSEAALSSKGEAIDELVGSIKSVIDAEGRRYLMADVPRDAIADAESIIPGLEGPTVLEIAGNPSYVALHAVIDAGDVFRVIADLKRIGAKGVLTTPIERLVDRWPAGRS